MKAVLTWIAVLGLFTLELGAIIAFVPPATEYGNRCSVTGNGPACLAAVIYGGAFVLSQAGVFCAVLLSSDRRPPAP